MAASNRHDIDPLTDQDLDNLTRTIDINSQKFEILPSREQLLGRTTVFCMMINRTIGSGIFTVPAKVLSGTGSIGGSLLVWAGAGVIVLCGACVWLELGLTIPGRRIIDEKGVERWEPTPRSAGEKNYIEYVFKSPPFLATSMYGIMFIILGNISGNAIAFGIYCMKAAGRDPYRDAQHDYWNGPVIGLAVSALTICAGFHIFSRRGGIFLNNFFAFFKIGILVVIILIGFIQAGQKNLSKGFNEMPISTTGTVLQNITSSDINNSTATNFKKAFHNSWGVNRQGDVGSYIDCFLFALFACTGFEHPFYVLSEVRNPRRVFPRWILGTTALMVILYMLTNIAYYCVVPEKTYLQDPASTGADIAGIFFHQLFDHTGTDVAERVMAGLTAVSVFGNIIIITFTAARVKAEIAKEGILPWSFELGSSYTTPWGKWMGRAGQFPAISEEGARPARRINGVNISNSPDRSPIAALGLHWSTSILLVLVSLAWKKPAQEYSFLVFLYSYFNFCVIGLLTSSTLFYLKLDGWILGNKQDWAAKANWKPRYFGPFPAVLFWLTTVFFAVGAFVTPGNTSPFNSRWLQYPNWLVPLIGMGSLLLGVVWWCGFKMYMEKRGEVLVVTRKPYLIDDDDGRKVQKYELIEHRWIANTKGA